MAQSNKKEFSKIEANSTIIFFRDNEIFNKFLNIAEKHREMYIDGTLYGVGSGFDFSCAGTKFNCLLIRLNPFARDEEEEDEEDEEEYEEDDFYKMESCYVASFSQKDLRQFPTDLNFLIEKELYTEIIEDSYANYLEIIVIDDNKEKPVIYAEKSPGF